VGEGGVNNRLDSRFAEYVTRVAFDLTLSRGQITTLAIVKAEQERDKRRMKAKRPKPFLDTSKEKFQPHYSSFVPGVHALIRKGLVKWDDPAEMKPRWDRYPYALTEAGECVFRLLEIAGLVRDAARFYEEKAA
jgi:hypothetical protein